MATPTSLPQYIYKILPPSPPPPSPLPLALPVSPLDSGDGFIHLSTSHQILGTLQNFFTEATHVYILRVPYERVQKWIEWEDAKGKGPDVVVGCWDVEREKGLFPHVYGNGENCTLKLGRDEVESVGEWRRAGEVWGAEGWPFGEDDVPKE